MDVITKKNTCTISAGRQPIVQPDRDGAQLTTDVFRGTEGVAQPEKGMRDSVRSTHYWPG